MNYTEVDFKIISGEDYLKDLLLGALAENGFDTFEDTETGFKGYISTASFNESALLQLVSGYRSRGLETEFSIREIPSENWNAVWESNFEPLVIGGRCYVRATFHAPQPHHPYEIVIDPKMAFGTGHHQTTSLMIGYLLEEDLNGKRVLDMGCGTGILAIFSAMAGAEQIVAIDNDPVCYESTIENCRLNRTTQVNAVCGSSGDIPGREFDVIVANINRNILLDQMNDYSAASVAGGTLLLSGFYAADLSSLVKAANVVGFTFVDHRVSNDWTAARLIRMA